MAHDCHPYWLRDQDKWTKIDYKAEAKTWMKPLQRGKETGMVEIPASWDVSRDGRPRCPRRRLAFVQCLLVGPSFSSMTCHLSVSDCHGGDGPITSCSCPPSNLCTSHLRTSQCSVRAAVSPDLHPRHRALMTWSITHSQRLSQQPRFRRRPHDRTEMEGHVHLLLQVRRSFCRHARPSRSMLV
jgi:hypothetical protein